ncbi:MAG: hypothetical protein Q9169_008084 [Polycauliona sp. 2 TL-2023]
MGDTIPFEFVQEMAVRGAELAIQGFTELYDIMYQNADGSIMVSVSLRLMEHVLPGPESGSGGGGGSSQTADGYWREGSVPSVGSGADAAGAANNNNLGYANWGGTR